MLRHCSFCTSLDHDKRRCARFTTFSALINPINELPKWREKCANNYKKWVGTHICNLTEDNFVASLNREYAYFQFNERRIQTVENRLALIQNQRQTRDARHTRIAEIDTEIEQITELMLQDYANRQQFELIFDICDNSGVSTCDICMVDDIPNTGMVKTGCGHDYCAMCMLRILNKNPECAFCRGKINKICVSSQEAFDCFCER